MSSTNRTSHRLAIPEEDIEATLRKFLVKLPEGIETYSDFILERNPAVLKAKRIPPPTIIVWYDGRVNGDFISQLCFHKPVK